MDVLIPIATQLVAGTIGGHVTGAALKKLATSMARRTVLGAIGGVIGGLLVQLIIGDAGLTGLLTNGIGGLIGGGVLTALAGGAIGKK